MKNIMPIIPEARVKLVLREDPVEYEKIFGPHDAIRFVKNKLIDYDREVFGIINLSSKGSVLNWSLVGLGTITSCFVSTREIMKCALLSNASGIIAFHNHPSGDPTPSGDDIETTKKLAAACRLMEIGLLDHIIVGAETGEVFSFADQDMLSN